MSDVNVGGTLSPFDLVGPVTRATQNKGGHQEVADAAARDAIPSVLLTVGMYVVTQDDLKTWKLIDLGPTWEEVVGSTVTADWDDIRYFALDYDNGDDEAEGFSDVDVPTAGAVAKKTREGLEAIIPPFGNGRRVEIVINTRAAGANYLNLAAASDLLDMSKFSGYSRFSIRGTGTVATAGATAFADDDADQICQGAQNSTLFNAAGYKITKETDTIVSVDYSADEMTIEHNNVMTFTTGQRLHLGSIPYGPAITVVDSTHFRITNVQDSQWENDVEKPLAAGDTITRFSWTNASGAQATVPSDANARWVRLRGDSANTGDGGANSNRVVTIMIATTNTGLRTVIFEDPEAIVAVDPVNDIWYAEEPGVAFTQLKQSGDQVFHISGIRFTTSGGANLAVNANANSVTSSFLRSATAFDADSVSTFETGKTWTNASGVPMTVGPVKITAGNSSINNANSLSLTYFSPNAGMSIQNCRTYRIYNAAAVGDFAVLGCGSGAAPSDLGGLLLPTIENLRLVSSGRVRVEASNGFATGIFFDGTAVFPFSLATTGATWLLRNVFDFRAAPEVGLVVVGDANNIIFLGHVHFRGDPTGSTLPGKEIPQISLLGDVDVYFFPFTLRVNDLFFGGFRDPHGNTLAKRPFDLLNGTTALPDYFAAPATALFANDDVADIPRFSLVRSTGLTAEGHNGVGLVLADAEANEKGDLLVATLTTFGALGASTPTFCHAGPDPTWVRSDDTPAVGDPVFVSTATAGRVQSTAPGSGTRSRPVGNAMKTATAADGTTLVLMRFSPDKASTAVP